MKTIVLSTGGTGGHVFPANQLAYALKNKGYHVQGVTDQRGRLYLDESSFDVIIELNLRKGGGIIAQLKQLGSVLCQTIRCWRLFRKNRPDLVVAFGGYMSAPPLLAACFLRIPYILHETNAVLGRVNRLMSRGAKAIAFGFPFGELPALKCPLIVTGNPVRDILFSLAEEDKPTTDKLRLFVFGGSQGAALFSRVVPEAISLLPLSVQNQMELVMQVRPEKREQTETQLRKTSVSIRDLSPFFKDLPQQLQQAQLVIARAGAMTVSEIAAMGRSTIFVPLKIATDNHQYYNVKDIVEHQAAWMILEADFTPQRLAEILQEMIEDNQQGGARAKRIRSYGNFQATQDMVSLCERVGGI